MNKEAYARLIGILYTDGCVSPKAVSSWRLIVSNNSLSVVDEFGKSIEECFGKSLRRSVRGCLNVGVLDSKEIGTQLIKQHQTFRTEACAAGQGCPSLRGGRKSCHSCEPIYLDGVQYPPASLPDFSSTGEISAFLQAAFSCDGGVNLYVAHRGNIRWLIRNTYLACKHPILIHQYAGLLLHLGIKSRVMANDWRVLIQGRKALEQFSQWVGFLPNSIIGANSKFWHTRTKSDVLELLLQSYGDPQVIYNLPAFSQENDG
jgi:hypothetical protein